MLLVYAGTFYSGALWDDNVFIFNSDAITKSAHPFVFFNYKTSDFRAWPLGYVLFWVLYKVFGTQFVLYKILNLVLHFFNFYLVRQVSQKLNLKHSLYIGLIFLFHTFHVETISWIFQLNTILATSFFLLSFRALILEKKVLSVIFFSVSLLIKSYAAFTPFVFLIYVYSQRGFKESLKTCVPFFIISLLVGYGTIRGINTSSSEVMQRKKFHTEDAVITKTITEITPVAANEEVLVDKNEVEEAKVEFTETVVEVITSPTLKPETEIVPEEKPVEFIEKRVKIKELDYIQLGLNKLLIISNSCFFYLRQFILPTENLFIYPEIDSLGNTNFIALLLFFVLFTSFLLMLTTRKYHHTKIFLISTMILTIWIPISGIFYVPFMKYAPYTDHWAYMLTFPLAACLIQLIEEIRQKWLLNIDRKFIPVIFLIPIIFYVSKTINYSAVFNIHENMLRRNIAHNSKNIFLRRYLATELSKNKEYNYAIIELENAQRIEPYNLEIKIQLDKYKEKIK